MQSRRLLVAVNPAASFGRSAGAGERAIERIRAAGHLVTPCAAESLPALRLELAAALDRDGPDALVVVGGDGMVSLGASLVAGTSLPLGVIPTGTGNDVARGLRLPLGDPAAAVRVLLAALAAPVQRIDAIRVRHSDPEETTWVVGAVSAGFDALVNERANAMRFPRGASRYTLAMLRELASLRPISYRLVVDGKPRQVDAVLLAAANNASIGGGMRIAPAADLADGSLDLLTVAPLGRLRFVTLFPRVFRGRHVGLRPVRLEPIRTLALAADRPLIAYGDGERLGPLPLTLEVVPAALGVLAPQLRAGSAPIGVRPRRRLYSTRRSASPAPAGPIV
ncbi:MAG: diacylglycerol kinase [Naasia sp.]|uniref:diacylglycerol kinase family protein n=1 Tax=Naasia sp. TaxID=2546198 RepID=UPI0026126607|nr:diacylglycerol kinase family protein [Naasia sp.]MCU1570104.1 diacylglycerol kinase [Naasia sp.]